MNVVYPETWERKSVKVANGNVIDYVCHPSGTHYYVGTPSEVISILEGAMHNNGPVIRVFYGDKETGRDWMEEFDTIGYVNRSCGPVKVPILLHNSRSDAGGAILTNNIVRITIGKREVYRHPNYHQPALTVGPAGFADYAEGAYSDGQNVANFRKPGQAERYVAFMRGERNAK